jgi:hypothetical protein
MTPEQKAWILYFKMGVMTANELLAKFGRSPSQDAGANTFIVPYGKSDGYAYISLDRKTVVNISDIFPSSLLKVIAA